jgi:hypothetical protein
MSDNTTPNKVCCFCKKDAGRYGNNPRPVMDGNLNACCDKCNVSIVIPARLAWAEDNRCAFCEPKKTEKRT